MHASSDRVETVILCRNGGSDYRHVALQEESEEVQVTGSISTKRDGILSRVRKIFART